MNAKRTGILLAVIAAAALLFFFLERLPDSYMPAEDEIALRIQLDLKEDIGLLLVGYKNAAGTGGQGGLSNADRTMLSHDDTLFFTIPRHSFGDASDTEHLTLRFTVISEYQDPNFEDIYPEELKVPLDPVTLEASYGKSYPVTIRGGRDSGYQAVIDRGA